MATIPSTAPTKPITAFKVRATYKAVAGTLPRLRFGARYRMRARAVDLAGNSLRVDDPLADTLALIMGLPRDPEGQVYLRYEPVAAPLVVIRDQAAVTGPGSAVHRLVMRTFNDGIDKDGVGSRSHRQRSPHPAAAHERRAGRADGHVRRPRRQAQERSRRRGAWRWTATKGSSRSDTFEIAGKIAENVPIETTTSVDALPYLPDLLSRGAAIRDLPGSGQRHGRSARARTIPPPAPVAYSTLADINPRPGLGHARLVQRAPCDWQRPPGFRLALGERPARRCDAGRTGIRPRALLTVFLPKGHTAVVPLSSYMTPDDLKLMGQWQWLREFVDIADDLRGTARRISCRISPST